MVYDPDPDQLPSASLARTSSVCVSPAENGVAGVQELPLSSTQAAPSSERWNPVASPGVSQVQVGLVSVVGDAVPVTVGSGGGVRSIVTLALSEDDQLPAVSRPCTHSVYDPSTSVGGVYDATAVVVHGPVVLSREYRHSTVPAVVVHVHVGIVLFVGEAGPVTFGAAGGDRSIVTLALSEGDQLPAASRPCTHRVCVPAPSAVPGV